MSNIKISNLPLIPSVSPDDVLPIVDSGFTTTYKVKVSSLQGTSGTSGVSGSSGTSGTSGLGFTWQGGWQSITTYFINDVVYYSGASYVALGTIAAGGNPPDVNASWENMSAQGAAGTSGSSGSSGTSGSSGVSGTSGTDGTSGSSGTSGQSNDVYSGGTLVVSGATILNFSGATITSGGTGQANITITPGSTSPFKIAAGTNNSNNIYDTNVMAGSYNTILGGDGTASIGAAALGACIIGSIASPAISSNQNIGIYSCYGGLIDGGSYRSAIIASYASNITNGTGCAIIGSYARILGSSAYDVLLGGVDNTLTSSSSSAILGGDNQTITTSNKSAVIGGNNNTITSSPNSSIIASNNSSITGGTNVVMLGTSGRTADASNTTYVEKIKGFGNLIEMTNGGNNTISNTPGSFILGNTNTISQDKYNIVMGTSNNITGAGAPGTFGSIVNGAGNSLGTYAYGNFVMGGYNSISQPYNFRLGNNASIGGSGTFSFGEQVNIAGNWSFGFGNYHTINTDYSHSFGLNNDITGTGSHNTILGGKDNVIDNKSYVAIIGCSGRTATTSSATFVENLVIFNYASLNYADDTAAAAGGVVLGQVYHTAGILKIRVA